MNKTIAFIAMLLASVSAHAVQETFTTAGPLDCTAVNYCKQNTADNQFTLTFKPTYPTSAPSSTGFDVNQNSIEISNATGGLMDMSIMSVTLTGSKVYNGSNFLGAIRLEVQDELGNWSYLTQWSTYISSSKNIYVIFNGQNQSSPLVKGVRAIRLTGVNGATAFKIGMMYLNAY